MIVEIEGGEGIADLDGRFFTVYFSIVILFEEKLAKESGNANSG